MRILCALLAVYVLALSVHTCSDGNAQEHVACAQEQSGDEHHDLDVCSPFCTCTCCAGITYVKVVRFQQVVVPMHTRVYSESTAAVLSMPRTPVWQPPQA